MYCSTAYPLFLKKKRYKMQLFLCHLQKIQSVTRKCAAVNYFTKLVEYIRNAKGKKKKSLRDQVEIGKQKKNT